MNNFTTSNEKIVEFLRSTPFSDSNEMNTAEKIARLLAGEEDSDYAGFAENYLRTYVTAFREYERTLPLSQEWRVYLLSTERAQECLADVLRFVYTDEIFSGVGRVLNAIKRKFDK